MQLLDEQQAIVGIASRDTVEEMQAFVDRHGLQGMVTIADPDGEVWERFEVFGQPSWGYVDPAGEVSILFGALGLDGIQQAFADNGFG